MLNPFFKYIIPLLLFVSSGVAVAGNKSGEQYPFKEGEEIICKVYYNWGPVWIDAGRVVFKTEITEYDNKNVYHFEATGKTLKKWSWLFKLEDYYQAYVLPDNLRPLFYEKYTVEGGYMMHNRYFFDYESNTIRMITEASRKPLKDTVTALRGEIYDVITAVNYLRTLNTGELLPGDTIFIPVVLNGKFFTQKLIYSGKTDATINDKKISLIRYSAVLSESSFFSDDNAVNVYLTDDKNRRPVFISAKIVIGAIKVYMENYTGIKLR